MGLMKTPGVYIVEKNAFPNSVVEVSTAVPAFIGYTEKADNKGKSLHNKPWRISSMSEFHNYYGYGPSVKFSISEKDPDSFDEADFSLKESEYILEQTAGEFLLYNSMLLFFQNGGGPCYIVSVGNYTKPKAASKVKTPKAAPAGEGEAGADDAANNAGNQVKQSGVDEKPSEETVEADSLRKGIEVLIKEQEPTILVIPETVLLLEDDAISVQVAALKHCGYTMKNRIAILDIWGGHKDRQDTPDCIESFRSKLGINYLDYGTAYYPWVNTTIVQGKDLNYENIENATQLQELLFDEIGVSGEVDEKEEPKLAQQATAIKSIASDWEGWKGKSAEDKVALKSLLSKSLIAISPLYGNILLAIKDKLNLLPPAAAMAGVYTMVDNSRGVWKAPANVSLNSVISPAVNITHDEQEDLNVTTQGKSINAVRSFIGEGTLVWGARTLDGNSLDWRYINVRRTMIMLEESIRLATKAYVFEPNNANTWVTIKSMIRNFLTGIWKRGGLAGAVPDDAFSIHVGLGDTMTSEDILEGILRVTVLVAISRPAEFIEITFQQQLQKS